MGLLSDPSLTRQNKTGRNLAKHSRKLCVLFYIAGLVWYVCLSHPELNHGTYLSENALSPGLVQPEIRHDSSRFAQTLLEELERELVDHKLVTPYAWILAKMRQIGLETHVHNFTLRYPFAGGKEFHGKNIYGILRAPRIGSTEGIVFSAPFRASTSVHAEITPSVPVLLAFADMARRKNYWAKDLIFLVTEQEQLGAQAWLKAYHEGDADDAHSVLKCGNLPARAGALQAALNLEIQAFDSEYSDIKIEGLNGQLPNLDMFNLVQRITSREGIRSGYKQTKNKRLRSVHAGMEENLKHMSTMLLSQATGVPTGNHGLFLRYRVEALTIETVKHTSHKSGSNNKYMAALPLLRTIEGISRSLNNLLERFHQSYFFYILVQNDRFVSIGDYMPCLALIAGPLFIKAFLLWITIDGDKTEEEEEVEEQDESDILTKGSIQLPYRAVLVIIGAAILLGASCAALPMNNSVRNFMSSFDIYNSTLIGVLLITAALISLAFPFIFSLPQYGLELLHIGTSMFLGVALIVVGFLNFALGFLVAIVAVPLGIAIGTEHRRTFQGTFSIYYALLINPLVVVFWIALALSVLQFPELALKDVLLRSIGATLDAITFSLMDCIVYGNWLYILITAVFFPLWTLCWTVAVMRRHSPAQKLKAN